MIRVGEGRVGSGSRPKQSEENGREEATMELALPMQHCQQGRHRCNASGLCFTPDDPKWGARATVR